MPRHRHADSRPLLEPLEGRLALSAEVNASGVLVITGSPQADTIVVEPGPEAGTAVLTGVPGVEDGTVFSGFEHVRVDLKSGDDTFTQTGALTSAAGFACNLAIKGGNGNDTITIEQDNAGVSINGGNAHDTINDGPANSTLRGGRGQDTVRGNDGHDEIHGGLGKDLLIAGAGNDTVNGGNQADEIWGNSGLDNINGGLHRDVMWGGGDGDQITGGAARDRFNAAPDEVLDYSAEDENFDPAFDPTRNVVLPGTAFWNRVAEGEAAGGGRLSAAGQNVVRLLTDAVSRTSALAAAFMDQWEAATPNDRQSASQSLRLITDLFSPDLVADPTALTIFDLVQFQADLTGELGGFIFLAPYDAYTEGLVEELGDTGFPEAVHALTPGSPETHGVLFAMDSIFNLSGDL